MCLPMVFLLSQQKGVRFNNFDNLWDNLETPVVLLRIKWYISDQKFVAILFLGDK